MAGIGHRAVRHSPLQRGGQRRLAIRRSVRERRDAVQRGVDKEGNSIRSASGHQVGEQFVSGGRAPEPGDAPEGRAVGDVERRKASIKEFDRHRVRAAGQDSGEVHAGAWDQVPVLHQARGHVPSATGEGQSDTGAVRRRFVAKEVKAQPVGVGQGRAEPAQFDQRAMRSASTEEHSQAGGRRQHRTAADDVLHEQRRVRRNMVFV